LIRPYPPRYHTLLKVHAPTPKRDGILVLSSLEKIYRTGQARDTGAGSVQKLILKPFVPGFPDNCKSCGSHCWPC
jgi:hypothetical protein